MSHPGPASAPEPPSVVVGHHPDIPDPVLREVLAGAEEEGVPVTTWPDPGAVGGPDGVVALAHRAAQRSRLDVGVGIDADGSVVVHHTTLPADRPAFTMPNVARKLDPAPTINDLNIVEIPPLSIDEGLDMSKRIFSSYVVEVPEEVLLYMLGEIQWLMPFFIQLVVQLLIDESENEQKPIDKALVDKVLLKAANHRNNVYFASYLDRLSKTLPADQCETAKAILSHIATHGLATRNVFQQDNAQSVLETLEYDGYIHEHEGNFRFNSPILRMWWKKNA